MNKEWIKNRHDQNIAVLVDEVLNARDLAFVMHGLGGFKEQPHIETVARACVEKGFTTIRFDTANTIGESEGSIESATATNYKEDLEDVILWAKSQSWYAEPYVLIGHSTGGLAIIEYAIEHPSKIKGLIPMAPVVTGEMYRAHSRQGIQFDEWERVGYIERESASKPGAVKRIRWSFIEDLLTHDILKDAKKIPQPMLLVTSDRDEAIPKEDVYVLYEALPNIDKQLVEIEDSGHNYKTSEQLEQLSRAVSQWLDQHAK